MHSTTRCIFLSLATALLHTACSPDITPDALPAQTEQARYLLFITHGSGDTAAGWPDDVARHVDEALAGREEWDIVAYDWSRYAEDRATASKAGQRIGTYIGETLASAAYRYEAVQLVAHSVGAFVIQAACDAYRARQPSGARMHLTFLDPFTGDGLFDWTYGKRGFGAGADFAEAYINTDDPVPSTSGRLDLAHNFDVTPRAPQSLEGSARHWWPVDFYRETIGSGSETFGYALSLMVTGAGAPAEHALFPRGAETVVQ